ncbi:MAG: hypothetical protein HY751_13230 [Nitrospinae bacterium]|nr:hypothetical protein [Nitrospinota bacterium]
MASITVLNRLLPYVEPIAMETPSFAISAVDEETVAVIHTALATYLQRAPGKLIITPADRQ